MKTREPRRAYLAACTIYRDDADYLAEWIEFHRLVGVERFVLYDNGSQDHHLEVLRPYLEDDIVTLYGWPAPFLGLNGRPRALFTAFEHCVGAHRGDTRWLAFLDIDEFLFSPTGMPVAEILRDYEGHPGVVVSRAEFGPSGHVTKPDGLVIESYVERQVLKPDDHVAYKSIVEPGRVRRCLSAHSFVYRDDGVPVDEEMRPVDQLQQMDQKRPEWQRLRIHHYFSRSEEERVRKAQLWRDAGSARGVRVSRFTRRSKDPTAPFHFGRTLRDETLATYVPAVREVLARRAV